MEAVSEEKQEHMMKAAISTSWTKGWSEEDSGTYLCRLVSAEYAWKDGHEGIHASPLDRRQSLEPLVEEGLGGHEVLRLSHQVLHVQAQGG